MSSSICQGSLWRAGVKGHRWCLDVILRCTSDAVIDPHNYNSVFCEEKQLYMMGSYYFYYLSEQHKGHIVFKWLFVVSCCLNQDPLSSVFINLLTKSLKNVIYLLDQEAVECQALSQPMKKLPADFLGWASSIHAPCLLDWAEGRG